MRLLVELPERLLVPNAPEALVKITKGVAARLSRQIKDMLDPRIGSMSRITNGLRTSIDDIDDQLEQMNERIERKREGLQRKFAKLEGQIASLRSQQNFLSGQTASLPGGKGGGLPGL